jgi:hypothetical protein
VLFASFVARTNFSLCKNENKNVIEIYSE